MLLKREMYLRQIRPFYDSDIIKVITGVRRAGKSVILESIRDELAAKGISAGEITQTSQLKIARKALCGKG